MKKKYINRKKLEQDGWIVVAAEEDCNDESANTGYKAVDLGEEDMAESQRSALAAEDVPTAATHGKDYLYTVDFEEAIADSQRSGRVAEDVPAAAPHGKDYLYTVDFEEAIADSQRRVREAERNRTQLSDENGQAEKNVSQRKKMIFDIIPELAPDNCGEIDNGASFFKRSHPFQNSRKQSLKTTDDKLSPFMLAKFLLKQMMFAAFYGQLCLYCAPAFRIYDTSKLVAECRKYLGDDVFKSYGWNGIIEAFKFLASDPDVVDISTLNHTSRPLFVFKNGVVSEKPKQIRPAAPEDFIFAFCNCEYKPARRKDNQGAMDRYLDFLADGDQELVELVWSVIGAVISQDTTFKKAFFFFGLTQTGKSVLGKLLSMIIGDDYLTSIPIGRFGRSFQLSEMQGKLANIVMDDSSDKLQDTSVFKSLTSGGLDSINANVKYGRDIRFRADTIKLVFGFNTLPELNPKEDLEPFFERLVIIPCMNQVPKDKRDEHLIRKLFAEKDYILFRAMKSFFQVKENGNIFPYSEASESALREYRDQYLCQDLRPISIGKCVREFVDQCCFLDSKTRSHSVKLYEAYCDFAYDHDYPLFDQDKVTRCIKDLFQLEKSKFRLNGPPLHGLIGVGLILDLPDSNDD